MGDGVAEPVDDRTALPGDALALQLGGVRRRLRRLHHPNLLGLGRHHRRVPQALLLVDLVHGGDDRGVRHELRDQGLVDLEAVGRHLGLELLLHSLRDVILFLKCLVEQHVRDGRAHDVRNIRLDLLADIGQLVHRIVCILWPHRLLNSNLACHEDVILRLRLHIDGVLLDAAGDGSKTDATRAAVEPNEGKARSQHVAVLTKVLHRIPLVLRYCRETIRAWEASTLLPLHCQAQR
mmetsp:Transcript_67473/g.188887  ORF Transcript_67473/g.188887 Transcript_67473/m.188887 type:complete len:236 (-) Transcript_67473:64-771(-)